MRSSTVIALSIHLSQAHMAAKALSEILKIWEGEVWAKEIDEAEAKMLVEGARWAREIDMEEYQKWADELTDEWAAQQKILAERRIG